MKKTFLFLALLCSGLTVSAQTYVWKGGVVIATDVDSVTFAEPAPVPVLPEEALSGLFSVSANKQVHFSRGNLQYTQSTDTWAFAEKQYDCIATENVTGGAISSTDLGDKRSGSGLADKIDLFGWSGSTGAKWGVSTSTAYADYAGDFADWGQNMGDNWRTLTKDEWEYVLKTRPNAADLRGVASVDGVNGLILLPDNWEAPDGVIFTAGFHYFSYVSAYGAHQAFSTTEWQILESAGAVFLPTTGFRNGTNLERVAGCGRYWSATATQESTAWILDFYADEASISTNYRYSGRAVRLVWDAE